MGNKVVVHSVSSHSSSHAFSKSGVFEVVVNYRIYHNCGQEQIKFLWYD